MKTQKKEKEAKNSPALGPGRLFSLQISHALNDNMDGLKTEISAFKVEG